MRKYKITINAHHWQGQAQNMGAAVRSAALMCGVSLDQCGLIINFVRV